MRHSFIFDTSKELFLFSLAVIRIGLKTFNRFTPTFDVIKSDRFN